MDGIILTKHKQKIYTVLRSVFKGGLLMSTGLYKGKFFECFGIIYDKRQPEKVKHRLIDVLFIIVAATFCRIDELEGIYYWAKAKQNEDWLNKYVDIKEKQARFSSLKYPVLLIKCEQRLSWY